MLHEVVEEIGDKRRMAELIIIIGGVYLI